MTRRAVLWPLKIVVSVTLLYVLLARVDLGRLWETARTASVPWLVAAVALYGLTVVVSAWRWDLLLRAQQVRVGFGGLLNSFLVATFFNNFLPSNIGGDVVRIRDTSRPAGSKTLAATVVLVDRGVGLMGLVFVAACGTSGAARLSDEMGPLGPGLLWTVLAGAIALTGLVLSRPGSVGTVLTPLRTIHQDWVGERITRLTDALGRFGRSPGALVRCLAGAVVVQAVIVLFYSAIARALAVPVPLAHLAIVVPISFVVQMLPISVNGFGVREATFGFYFTRLGLPLESALALSFIGAALIMVFSTSGAIAYLARRSHRAGAVR